MGVINFGWLAVRVPIPDWLCSILVLCDVYQALRWSRRAWWMEMWAVTRLCIEYTNIAFQLKITETPSQGDRMAIGCSAPNAILFVDLAIAGVGLGLPVVPCRPWLSRRATGSTLGQRKYLPSCRTRGSPHQLTLSQSSRSGLWCGRQKAERQDPRVSACYLRTNGHQ
jgi:hypothetical protein